MVGTLLLEAVNVQSDPTLEQTSAKEWNRQY